MVKKQRVKALLFAFYAQYILYINYIITIKYIIYILYIIYINYILKKPAENRPKHAQKIPKKGILSMKSTIFRRNLAGRDFP